jgi:hypothetical protein
MTTLPRKITISAAAGGTKRRKYNVASRGEQRMEALENKNPSRMVIRPA